MPLTWQDLPHPLNSSVVTLPLCLKHTSSRPIVLTGTGFSALTSGVSAGTCFYTAPQDTSYLNPPFKAGSDSQIPLLTKPKGTWGTASATTRSSITFTISAILASLFPTQFETGKGSDLQHMKCLLARCRKGNSHTFLQKGNDSALAPELAKHTSVWNAAAAAIWLPSAIS